MLCGARFCSTSRNFIAGWLLAALVIQTVGTFAPHLVMPLLPVAEAATGNIFPNGDIGTNTGTRVGGCLATSYFDCFDEGTTPNLTDYVELADGNQTNSNMTTLSAVQTVTSMDVLVHHEETRANMTLSVTLVNSAGGVIAGPTALTNRAAPTWDTATFSGLSLTQADLDGVRVRLSCARTAGGPARQCRAYTMYSTVTFDPVINLTVGTVGSQNGVVIGTTNQHIGGSFVITENLISSTISSITIAEQGTVDASTNLSNIKLFYDLDTTAPYDCVGEAYAGTEPQYGSTVTGGFSAANGTATFTGSVGVTATQALCLYPVMDIGSGATNGQTLEIQITDPSTQVVGSGGELVEPATPVAIAGTTNLTIAILTQENYHWRNDDGSETTATSDTGGVENAPEAALPKSTTKRLRMAVYNAGTATSDPTQFRLEYAEKTAAECSNVGLTWVDVGAVGGDFDMALSSNFADSDNTTDIAVANGGVTNPDTTFETPNGGMKESSSQTGNITLGTADFVELEYAIAADAAAVAGTSYCFRVTNAGTAITYTNYPEATITADVQVDSTGSEAFIASIPGTDQYAGGALRLTQAAAGAQTLTSVTITASGTIDAQNDLSNVTLRYDTDTTAPYDCASESYAVSDTQFGTAGSFNGSNELTFSGSASINNTAVLCLYVEFDVGAGATNGELLDLRIFNPTTQVVVTSSTVAPSSPVDIAGVITFAAPFLEQTGYHWRNNDGDETAASSATGGVENTPLDTMNKNSAIRLRIGIANTGLASSPSTGYQLQWAQKISTCSAISNASWTGVDVGADEFAMNPVGTLTDGANTTNVLVANGGVTDVAGTFFASNGGVKDTTDTTGAIVLPADNYLDLEFAISAQSSAVQGATYCFRATSTSATIENFANYPEVTIALDNDFKIQRGVSTVTGTTLTLVAGTDYEAPASANSAFVRITNTQLTGAGPNTGNSNNNADDVTAYISNPANITTNFTISRPAAAVGNTRVAWEIIEYIGPVGGENELIVRGQGVAAHTAVSTSVNSATVSGVVTDADVVVFITGQSNEDAGRNGFNQGLSTALWTGGGTNQATFNRGASGAISNVSYAVVEFTGTNWAVQRVENTYTTANPLSPETQAISAVNSLARTFLHTQKRTAQNNHADFGHEVWLSGLGQVSFTLDGAASTPANHTSVAWVIENTQSVGERLQVYRSSGSFASAGLGPESNLVSIGATLDDLSVASIFTNNRSDEAQRSWPEPILAARITSNTQYELWRSDTTANINFRTEIVEWPTAARKLTQNYFRLYENDPASITPSTPWPGSGGSLGENTEMTADDNPMRLGSTTRIRMSLTVSAAAMPAGLDAFKLQYGNRDTASCSAISVWNDLGAPGSGAQWRGVDNTPIDGTVLSTDPPTGGDLLLTLSTVAGTYEESNDTALNPYTAFPGDEIEYDWVVQHNGADDKSSYCFRMVEADGSSFEGYNNYPVLRTVGYDPRILDWRWYDDEASVTPVVPLAAENVAPTDIVNDNVIKLRVVLKESSGADGPNTKFSVQYSQYADFSAGVATATPSALCTANSLWCYADGAGNDNAVIPSTVISTADTCPNGCGTYNESTSTVGTTFDHLSFAASEFEFTLRHAGARANGVYYFRMYDEVNQEPVPLASGSSYPSLVTQGAQLVFTVSGVDAGTAVASVVTDATSTPTGLNFGRINISQSREVAHEITVDTNATAGYQVFLYTTQPMLNSYGAQIDSITTTNAVPGSWASACTAPATGCVGYHTTDASLAGGSARFAPLDSYAALSTSPEEIMYSSIPIIDVHNVVYRLAVTELQPAGVYETEVAYIAVPTF